MTNWRSPRLAAGRQELAMAGQAVIESTRARTARLFVSTSQTIPTGTLTKVQFSSPTVELDTIDYLRAWDPINNWWVIPADARLIRLYGRLRYSPVSAAGQARLNFQQLDVTNAYSRQSSYATSGLDIFISIMSPLIQVAPGDTLWMETDHNFGGDEAIVARQFQIEFLEV